MTHVLSSYPARPREALSRLLDAVAPLAPEPSALVIYGSLAKGTYREGESDVNLAVVLTHATPATLFALSAPLRAARHAARVDPFVIERREIARLADTFPVKLSDIRAARHVLFGDDPFADVTIDREHLRLRTEQELRNHLVRLRHHAIVSGDDPRELARAIYRSASSLAIELEALLEVKGGARPADPSLRAMLRAAADALDLDRAVLERLAAVKEGADVEDARGLYVGLLAVLARAVELADTAEVRA